MDAEAEPQGFRVEQRTLPKTALPVRVVILEVAHLTDGPVLDGLRRRIEELRAEAGRLDLLVDLGRVELLSSAAIGLFGMYHRKLWSAKGRMKVCGISPQVMEVLRCTRLDGYFDIYHTQSDALASF